MGKSGTSETAKPEDIKRRTVINASMDNGISLTLPLSIPAVLPAVVVREREPAAISKRRQAEPVLSALPVKGAATPPVSFSIAYLRLSSSLRGARGENENSGREST
jgi:hypothetical protein